MGLSKGMALVFCSADQTEETVKTALGKIAEDCGKSELANIYKTLNARYGLPQSEIAAWAVYSPELDWIAVSDSFTEQSMGMDNAVECAKFYSETFNEAAIVFTVNDSDCAFVTFADTEGHGASRICGHWEGYADNPDAELLSPPMFLKEYMQDEDFAKLLEIWTKDYVFEEERIDEICSLLYAPSFYASNQQDEFIPEGAKLMSVRWEEDN